MTFVQKLVSVLGVSIVLIHNLATAREMDENVSKFIPDAQEVASATVVLTPPGLMTRAPLTEKQILGFGCGFTEDSKHISSLVNIIKTNLQGDRGQVGRFYLRNAIYLNLKSGALIRYTFSDAINRDQQIYGGIDYDSTGGSTLFLAQSGFLVDLRRWLPHDSVVAKDGKWCVEKNA